MACCSLASVLAPLPTTSTYAPEQAIDYGTALHLATVKRHYSMCGILLQAGAYGNANTLRSGEAPLNFAKGQNHPSIMETLPNRSDDRATDRT